MPLIVEIRIRGEWVKAGPPLRAGMPPGSMSHNGPTARSTTHNGPLDRQIYQFRCEGDHSILERSVAGADVELAGGKLRAMSSLGLERIARITPEQPFECFIRTDRMREPMRVRFRHEN